MWPFKKEETMRKEEKPRNPYEAEILRLTPFWEAEHAVRDNNPDLCEGLRCPVCGSTTRPGWGSGDYGNVFVVAWFECFICSFKSREQRVRVNAPGDVEAAVHEAFDNFKKWTNPDGA